MNGTDIWSGISLILIIAIGVLLGRQLSDKVNSYYTLPAQPQSAPELEVEAASIVKPPTNVEEYLDRYPNV